ncbi:MAG: YggS family pyridoxal phosphate-dependent enzyme, partial [Opitutales bacterium]
MNDLINESNFRANWALLNQRIEEACEKCGRLAKDVRILPITKTFPVGAAEYAFRAKCLAVGENRVQEALVKMEKASPLLQWELVGHLQSNKVKLAAGCFARIQSVDSLKLLRRLNVL